MKKVYSIIIILSMILWVPKVVFATEFWEKENKKREQVFQSALKSYLDGFMTEETPIEDRIIGYEMNGYGISKEGESDETLNVSITFTVTPVDQNNTTWSSYRNHGFAVFSKINNEYVLDKISRYPDHYDEFLKRFEEYKKNKQEQKDTNKTQIQGKEQNNFESQEIQKINNQVVISFSLLFIIASIFLLIFYKQKSKKKA